MLLGPECNHHNKKFKHPHGRKPDLRFDDVQSGDKIVAMARHSQKTTTNENLV
jgi:hypothetical protein